MTVRDIYDTRFSDRNRVLIKRATSEYMRSMFGYSKNYENVYEGEYVNIPIELFNLEVEVLKPLCSCKPYEYNMIVFCK